MHAGKERAAGNLRRHKLRWQIRESPLLNNERETTISNKQTKRPILMNILYLNICACVCWGERVHVCVKRHLHFFMKKNDKLYEGLPRPL